MEISSNAAKVAGAVAAVLFLGASVWAVTEYKTIRLMNTELREQRLTSEKYLTEKLFLERDLKKTEAELWALEEKKKTLDESIKELSLTVGSKDDVILKLTTEAISNRKKYQYFEIVKQELEDQLAILNGSIQQLVADKENLESRVVALLDDNRRLHDELGRARFAFFDMPLVEPLAESRDKLMVKAKRTRRLRASVVVPSAMKDITFRIIAPTGNVISAGQENGTLAIRREDAYESLASSSNERAAQSLSRVEMTFISRKKLTPGIYQIELLSENLTVGNLQLRLR